MKKLKVSALSGEFQVRELTAEDIPQVLRLCQSNPLFYEYCPPYVTGDGIRADMAALPPGKDLRDKYYLGYFAGPRLAAVMDLIDGFPKADTAFIGFFMTDAAIQGQGIGSRIVEDLCGFFRGLHYREVRLGWVQGNPQSEHFWHKNGFQETGVVSRQEAYTIIYAQRNLSHS